MNRSVHIYGKDDKVVFEIRSWDGIDRPQYGRCEVEPKRCQTLLGEFAAAILTASNAASVKLKGRKNAAEKKIEELKGELQRLEGELVNLDAQAKEASK